MELRTRYFDLGIWFWLHQPFLALKALSGVELMEEIKRIYALHHYNQNVSKVQGQAGPTQPQEAFTQAAVAPGDLCPCTGSQVLSRALTAMVAEDHRPGLGAWSALCTRSAGGQAPLCLAGQRLAAWAGPCDCDL